MPQRSANDTIQLALIGSGGMGMGDARNATSFPGVRLVAACDLYDGRLRRMKEIYGPEIFTTRDYREILARKDIDAVIIATSDHWHAQISVEALDAGKDVYCQKPMVQKVEQGLPVIEAQKRNRRIFVVGSQYVSSLVYEKAKQVIQAGSIGEINFVEAWLDRNTALGAWQYSIPPDASPQTVDWERYTANTVKRPWDPLRFFRWRNYTDYGTGVAGDLFVHLLSGLHYATGSLGPSRVFATGGLRFWKDGRDVPDVTLALLDYPKTDAHPEFTLALRVNFASGAEAESFGFRFVGSEGVMETGYTTVTLSKKPRELEPGYTIETFPQAVQEAFLKQYRQKYPPRPLVADALRPDTEEVFRAPRGYNAHRDHHRNFHNAMRTRKPFIEDAVFGHRACAPALLCNVSYYEQRVVDWDPVAMKPAFSRAQSSTPHSASPGGSLPDPVSRSGTLTA